jgi:LPS-assembly protein
MKILFLILGILFTLTSESFSSDKNKLGKPQSGQDETLRFSELDKGSSSPDTSSPYWLWGNGKPLSPSELQYLEAEEETPITDWLWGTGNGKPLTPNESLAMPAQLTFPNWVQVNDNPINRPPEKTKAPSTEKEVFLTADHMTHDNNRDLLWAWGKVIIRFDDRVIYADKVKVHNKTGDGKAIGHVIITQADGTRLESKKAEFNINNQQGRLFETRGKLGKNFYVKGKELTRYSEIHYTAQKAHLTTCEGKLPDWLFEAESMDIVIGDRVLFTNGVFKIRDIPILYIPVGYLPIDEERKSGLLRPAWGSGGVEGVFLNNLYYWAINGHSDATFGLDVSENRGFRPSIEYRYTPNRHTSGTFNASFIDDKITNSTFWSMKAAHSQTLPFDYQFSGGLDLQSAGFDRNFNDNTNARASRNTDSHATITKSWEGSSLDILARYRDSSQINNDQTFAQLPQITYKTQTQSIGDTNFFFRQDSSFASFLTDLDTSPDVDDKFSVQRFDFHPQISYTTQIAPWLAFTPTVGIRETIYSKGLDATNNNKRLDLFTRESFDISASLDGPRFEKIFKLKNKYIPKVKHLIEPRISYSFTPDIDEEDRGKIKVFDGNDTINRQSSLTYSLTQRILQKELEEMGPKEKKLEEEDSFNTREVLRFDISQTIDLIEATGSETSENKRPFSDLRFDLDSRLHDNLMLNFDATFDVHDNFLKTFNVELGVKPLDSLYFFFNRRFTKSSPTADPSTFIVATVDWNLGKGWRMQGTTRFDEEKGTSQGNNFTMLYDNPCKCWGFKFDIIERDSLVQGLENDREVKYLWTITLRGIGDFSKGTGEKTTLREFESIR